MNTFKNLLILLAFSVFDIYAAEWTDVTGFIKNPSFDNNRRFGWSYDEGEYWALNTDWECTEVPNATVKIWQTLKGLPRGRYRLSVQGFYRDGSQETAYAKYQNGQEQLTAYLFANDAKTPLKSLYTYSVNWPLDDYRWNPNDTTYYCDHPFDATLAFGDSAYWNSIEFDVNGDVTIGIRNDNYVENNWIVVDNFRLEYQGTKTIANSINVTLPKTTMEIGDRQTASVSFNPTNTTIKNILWTSSDAFVCAVNQDGIIEARNPGNATLTAATTDGSAITKTINVSVKAKSNDTRNWKDISFIINNPNFQDGTYGWTVIPKKDNWHVENGMIDCYNQDYYQIFQTIEGLPKGHYRISLQGFNQSLVYPRDYFRYIEGDSTSYAYLFAGDAQKTIAPFSSLVQTSKGDGNWYTYDEDKHLYPQDTEAKAYLIANGAYLNQLEFDIDGSTPSIKIGIALDKHKYNRNEATFANFKLETCDNIDLSPFIWTDVTGFIKNPSFDDDRRFGWSYDDGEYWGLNTGWGCTEATHAAVKIWQTLKGLPSGRYRLSVQGFYRDGSQESAYKKYLNGTEQLTACLFANNVKTPLKSLYSYSVNWPLDDYRWNPNDTTYYCNHPFDATLAFEDHAYINTIEFEVDGDVTIGVINDNYVDNNWLVVDNFRLEYNGTKTVANDIKVSLPKTTMEVGDRQTVSVSFNPTNTTIKNVLWTSSDAFICAVNQDGIVEARNPGNATLTAVTKDGSAITREINVTVVDKSNKDNYDWKDISYLITNPNFENDKEGWTIKPEERWQVIDGLLDSFGHDAFQVSQTIEGLPKGHYRLSMQGFCRSLVYPDDFFRYIEGDSTSYAYIFAGDTRMTISPYSSYIHTTQENESWHSYDQGKHYYPGDPESQSYAMAQGAFLNQMEFDVTQSASDILIGIALDKHRYNRNSTTFTNFKLETSDDIDFGYSYTLKVVDDENNDITQDVNISWTNATGETIGSGSSISGVSRDIEVFYSVTLNETLGRKYREVIKHKADVGEAMTCKLERIEMIKLRGTVIANGVSIPSAEVGVTQWLNKKYLYEISERTDADGNFDIEAYADSTEIVIIADGYENRRVVMRTPSNEGELGKIGISAVKGMTIALDLSYQYASQEGQEPIINNSYFETRNIQYQVRNKSKNAVIDNFSVQNRNIVLPSSCEKGDEIEVSLHSMNDKFVDAIGSGIIADNDTAKITLKLIAYGSIEAAYDYPDGENLLAMLYDNDGHMVMRTVSNTSRVTFSSLAEGNYSLVTMEYRGTIGSLSDMSDFKAMDLYEGRDYARTSAIVKNGIISRVSIANIPELDASKFDYIGESSSYLPNKTTLIAGNFVTMSARVNFKQQYADKANDVKLVVTIPDGCEMVANSVVIGIKPLTYSLNGNLLTIPLATEDVDQKIRFCITPLEQGKFETTAYAEFNCNGEKMQSVGQVSFDATLGEFYVPKVTKTPTFYACGYGLAGSEVEIYDGDRLVGKAGALGNGRWTAQCELNDPSNLSTHQIQAIYRDKGVMALKSEVRYMKYDINGIVAKTVTMLNYVHRNEPVAEGNPTARTRGKDSNSTSAIQRFATSELIKTVFDLENYNNTGRSYTFWPEEPDFTFIIDLSENDTTKVSNVTLYVHTTDGGVRTLPAQYDAKRNSFVAIDEFSTNCLPVRVGVGFDALTEIRIDAKAITEAIKNDGSEQLELELAEIKDFLNSSDAEDPEKFEQLLNKVTKETLGEEFTDDTPWDELGYSDEELLAILDESIEKICNDEYWPISSKHSHSIEPTSDGLIIEKKTCADIDLTDLVSQGFVEAKGTDDSKVYIYIDASHLTYIDPTGDLYYNVTLPHNNSSRTRIDTNDLEETIDFIEDSHDFLSNIDLLSLETYRLKRELKLKGAEYRKALGVLKRCKRPEAVSKWVNNLRSICKTTESLTANLEFLDKLGTYQSIAEGALSILSAKDKLDELTDLSNDIGDISTKCNGNTPGLDALSEAQTPLRHMVYNVGYYYMSTALFSACAGYVTELAIGAAVGAAIGTSALVAAAPVIAAVGAAAIISLYWGNWFEKNYEEDVINLKNQISDAARECGTPPPPGPASGAFEGPSSTAKQDPSGFVYEAVPTNRLADVKATVFYQDDNESPVAWDAEYYDEINPQITDETGVYAWDVPQGMWKVTFEKTGYETTETEWLPVPPPQLEINIPMTQAIAPNVEKARATESGVTLNFSKYMLPATLTRSDRIELNHNGKTVDGEVTLLDAEENPYNNEVYASRAKFITSEQLPIGDEVTLTVHKEVESYATKQMDADFVQTLIVNPDFTSIVCDSVLAVDYKSNATLNISVLPSAGAKGQKIYVTSTAPMIATVDKDSLYLDDNGCASIVVNGELPGTSLLYLSMEDVELSTSVRVNVVKPETIVRMPKASRRSGSTIEEDYHLVLTTDTRGATIYYTIDGSCPCDESARLKYTEPIKLPLGDVTVKAIAVRHDMEDSDVATFNYTVTEASDISEVIEEANVNVVYDDGKLVIEDAAGAKCRIFDLAGHELYHKQSISGHESINLPTIDIYIVSIQLLNGQTVVRKINRTQQ